MPANDARMLVVLGALAAACGNPEPAPPPAAPIVESPKYHQEQEPMPEAITCSTLAECRAYDNQTVRAVGVYQKHNWGKGKGRSWIGHAQIDLGDGVVMLGRYWHRESKRDAAEVERFEGQRVAVIGRFLEVTPPNPKNPPHAQQLMIPALIDIASIEPEL